MTALPLTGRRRWRAGLLWAGDSAALCLRSAAGLWGLIEGGDDPVEICAPVRKRAPAPWLRALHRPWLRPNQVQTVAGLRTTDLHLTLLELGAVASYETLEAAVHTAVSRGLTSSAYLLRRLEQRGSKGHKGVAKLREVLADSGLPQGVSMNDFERKLFRVLRNAGLPIPVPQFVVTDRDGWVARPDFAYPHHKIAIEAHSFRWHGSKLQTAEDAQRRSRLAAMGWRVIEIMWEVLEEQPEEVVVTIARSLGIEPLFS